MPQQSVSPPSGTAGAAAGLGQEEFARRFQSCARTMWFLAAGILGDRSLAEDVVQEAAITGLRRLSQFQGGSFEAWMGQIVRFTALNHNRKQGRNPQPLGEEAAGSEPEAPEPVPVTAGDDPLALDPEQFDDRVLGALQRLKESARSCLLLKVVGGLEYREIGEVLEIAEGTVASHIHRARERMREMLSGGESLEERRVS